MPVAPVTAHESRRTLAWHIVTLLTLCVGVEALFLQHGLGWFDEAWPLYAAKRLHEGGELYRDIFFLFPPGHLLPAWVARAISPPGIVLARVFYAAFDLALVVALYGLGRRMMPASFAWLGAALVAVAAPDSQLAHLLFGYRYLVFSVLALLAFGRRLDGGSRAWMFAAGAAAGVGLGFRLSPPFAVCCGIGLATVAASRDRDVWLRDGITMAGGLLLTSLPVWIWIAAGPGFETSWRELVVRLAALQSAQSLPAPALAWPSSWSRDAVTELFVGLQLRLYPLLLLAVWARCGWRWFRRGSQPAPPADAMLLAVTTFAAIYLVRAIGRTDDHHLYSALPPVCLVLAYVGWRALSRIPRLAQPRAHLSAALAALALWTFLMGTDRFLDPAARGRFALQSIPETVYVDTANRARSIDRRVRMLRRWAGPDDAIFSMSLTPIFYVLADRRGPGAFDIMMPGVFLDDDEEARFVERLEAAPPAVVVFPINAFDDRNDRSIAVTAPRVTAWVRDHYAPIEPVPGSGFVLLAPRGAEPPPVVH